MITVLHFYQRHDAMVAQYVALLERVMGNSAELYSCHDLLKFRSLLRKHRPDIVHLHGCWRFSYAVASSMARRKGARVVLSPHGQLEPWVINQRFWTEKLPKLLAYQRRVVRKTYAVIVMGRMEEGCMVRLKLNPRCETVLNSMITEALTDSQMAERLLAVYRKVLDSDQWPLMNSTTRLALRGTIKAGQTLDTRWLTNAEYEACKRLTDDEWRQVALYACQEGVTPTVAQGMEAVEANMTDFDASAVPCYYPKDIKPVAPLDSAGDSPEARLLSMVRSARKQVWLRRLTISHVVELSAAIRAGGIDENRFATMLYEKNLTAFAGKLMQVVADMTGLEEGLLPVKAKAGRGANKIETIITKHLRI